jgi:RimJ/RimL family protein N-acetyltransferase
MQGKLRRPRRKVALVRKAFTELGVQRVFAETMAVNHGSRRVLEKAGLVHVRTFHPDWDEPLDGAEHGEVEYALHRCEWRGSAGRRQSNGRVDDML